MDYKQKSKAAKIFGSEPKARNEGEYIRSIPQIGGRILRKNGGPDRRHRYASQPLDAALYAAYPGICFL
jgi:hypothetical protein